MLHRCQPELLPRPIWTPSTVPDERKTVGAKYFFNDLYIDHYPMSLCLKATPVRADNLLTLYVIHPRRLDSAFLLGLQLTLL